MPAHPVLRIHSPNPDILELANKRIKLQILERTYIRLSALMLVCSFFFIFGIVLTKNIILAFGAFVCCFTAYVMQGISMHLRFMYEEPTMRAGIEV